MKKILLILAIIISTVGLYSQVVLSPSATANVHTADTTGIGPGTYVTGSDGADLGAMLQDSLGQKNVLSYGATGDGVTDDYAAIQAAVDASNGGQVLFPPGTYLVLDTIEINSYTDLIGSGAMGETTLLSGYNGPILSISHDNLIYGFSNKVDKIMFKGSNSPDSTDQHGIILDGSGPYFITDNAFYQLGGNGIKFSDDDAVGGVAVTRCLFRENRLPGMYGRNTQTSAVNTITITNSLFTFGYHHGLDVIGNNINVLHSTFEFNDSSGINLAAWDTEPDGCFGRNTSIKYNYFEQNWGGEIFIDYWLSGGEYQDHNNLRIEDNVIFGPASDPYDKADADGLITVQRRSTSDAYYGMEDLYIGKNYYFSPQCYHVDLNSDVDQESFLFIDSYVNNPATEYNGLYRVGTDWLGQRSIGRKTITSIVAGTGITQTMLAPILYVDISGGLLDITANPQIADGWVDGQKLRIISNGASSPLKLDDGNGLDLINTSDTLYVNESIELMYFQTIDKWVQLAPVAKVYTP